MFKLKTKTKRGGGTVVAYKMCSTGKIYVLYKQYFKLYIYKAMGRCIFRDNL